MTGASQDEIWNRMPYAEALHFDLIWWENLARERTLSALNALLNFGKSSLPELVISRIDETAGHDVV
jgi:hypothetical protein